MASQPRLPVIDDSTPDRELFAAGMERGLDLSSRPEGLAYAGIAEPFPKELLIPRHEWQSRIQERKERKTRLGDFVDSLGIPYKDQKSLPYCWVFAIAYCMEIARAKQNQGHIQLSAVSVGAQIKNYRKVGGWGKEALEWIARNGINNVYEWPEWELNPKYANETNRKLALRNQCFEWWELTPRNLDQLISCLLRGFPIGGGFNFWGHEVTLEDADWQDGTVAIIFRNQWAGYGVNGRGILKGTRMLADDAVSPRSVFPS